MWAGLNPLADQVWPTGRIFGTPALNQIRECVCEEHKHMYCISGTGILKQADWHFQRMGLWELILVAQLVLNFFCNLHFFFFRVFLLLGKDGWTDSTQSHCMAGRIPALRCHFPFGNLSSYLFSLAAQTLTSWPKQKKKDVFCLWGCACGHPSQESLVGPLGFFICTQHQLSCFKQFC